MSAPTRSDSELAEVLSDEEWTAVAVFTHDDVLALRLTLLCAHTRPDLELWVTLFDKTIVHQLRQIAPAVHMVASAQLVARHLADECCASVQRKPRRGTGVRLVDDALRLLVSAGAGLLTTLAVQTGISMAALREPFTDALYFSTRSVATVADAPKSAAAPAWFKLASAALTVIALVLVALFTAALGPQAQPASADHPVRRAGRAAGRACGDRRVRSGRVSAGAEPARSGRWRDRARAKY